MGSVIWKDFLMGCAELKISKLMKPWDIVIELGENLPEGSWMLIGL